MSADIGKAEPAAGSKKRTHAARQNPSAKADLVLADGRPVTLDLGKISIREYRALFDKTQTRDDEDATMAKVAGMTVDELLDLPQPDYRRLTTAFMKKAAAPLADPN